MPYFDSTAPDHLKFNIAFEHVLLTLIKVSKINHVGFLPAQVSSWPSFGPLRFVYVSFENQFCTSKISEHMRKTISNEWTLDCLFFKRKFPYLHNMKLRHAFVCNLDQNSTEALPASHTRAALTIALISCCLVCFSTTLIAQFTAGGELI